MKTIMESGDVGFTNFEIAVDNNCGLQDEYHVMLVKPSLGNDMPGNTKGPDASLDVYI